MVSAANPTVFIIEDDAGMRQSLRWLLDSASIPSEGFESAKAFMQAYDGDRPGCLVLDVRLPDMSGVALAEILGERGSRLPIIAISGYADTPTAVDLIKHGAFDFLEKPLSEQHFLDRVHKALALDARRRQAQARREELASRIARLTAREREVFQEVVHGQSNKAVALTFGISEKTVEVHRARVMQKLGATSLAELVLIDLLSREPNDAVLLSLAHWLETGDQSS